MEERVVHLTVKGSNRLFIDVRRNFQLNVINRNNIAGLVIGLTPIDHRCGGIIEGTRKKDPAANEHEVIEKLMIPEESSIESFKHFQTLVDDFIRNIDQMELIHVFYPSIGHWTLYIIVD